MKIRGWACLLLSLSCCADPPPPVAPKPVPEAPRPPPPPPEVKLPPAPPDSVAAFPDEVTRIDDVSTDERLLKLMLADPVRAERALHEVANPDGWQVSILAQFALTRGEKSFDVDEEPLLPLTVSGGGVVSKTGLAWLTEDATPLLGPGKKALATLPLNTKVEVTALDGEWATVKVPIAQVAVYGETEHLPVRVISTPVTGRVKVERLSPVPEDAETLMREALSQTEGEHGRMAAVALWQRAWRVERSERTRNGLLRAAWAVRRASTVVRAALARNLAPVEGLRFAWACNTEDPSASQWVDVSEARPTRLPRAFCLSGLDARARCSGDREEAKARAEATRKWLEKVKLSPRPWLRFTVDARDPRQAFVVTTPLEVADACSDFEEVTFEAGSGQVRRLTLPLGTKGLVVWLPVARHAGAEFSVPSATSEGQAISWLRSRGHYRWTVSKEGDLQPSLTTNADSFVVSGDVSVTSLAIRPERDCSCNQ